MDTSKGTVKSLLWSWRGQVIWGAAFGLLWGVLTGGGSTPRAVVTIDEVNHIVTIQRSALNAPITLSEDAYSNTYATNLIQVALVYLLLCLVGGWVAWQLSRIRPRGQAQPRIGEGWYVYVVAFCAFGLVAITLFQGLQLGNLFVGDPPTPSVIAAALISFILPLFAGFGAFFIWFLRLPSVRAPDWETHIPPYRDWIGPLFRDLVRKVRPGGKGGVKSE